MRLQERVDGGSQQAAAQQEISLLMDAVQLLEAKLARLEADGSASVAAQQEQGVQELKQQVALATEAANKVRGWAGLPAGVGRIGCLTGRIARRDRARHPRPASAFWPLCRRAARRTPWHLR